MSTKTSIKRIALVAVSALGFGLLSVMPAKAAAVTGSASITPVRVSFTGAVQDVVPAASVTITQTGAQTNAVAATGGAAAAPLLNTIALTSAPSAAAELTVAQANVTDGANASLAVTANQTARLDRTATLTAAATAAVITTANAIAGITFKVNTAGTYSGTITTVQTGGAGNTLTTPFTFTTRGAAASFTVTPATSTILVGGRTDVTVAVKDAAGNATTLSTVDSLALSDSTGTFEQVAAGGDQSLSAADLVSGSVTAVFTGSGTAGTATLTVTPQGTLPASGLTAITTTITESGTINATVVTALSVSTPVASPEGGTIAGGNRTATVAELTPSLVISFTGVASATHRFKVSGTSGTINGAAATTAQYINATTSSAGAGTISLTLGGSLLIAGQSITVEQVDVLNASLDGDGGAGANPPVDIVVTQTARALGTATVTLNPTGEVLAAIGTTTSVVVNVADQFDGVYAGATVRAYRTGVANGNLLSTATTNANGNATVTVTNLSTITSGSAETYVFTATNAAGTVTADATLVISYTTTGTGTSLSINLDSADGNLDGALGADEDVTDTTLATAVLKIPAVLVPTDGTASNTVGTNAAYTKANGTVAGAATLEIFQATVNATPNNVAVFTTSGGAYLSADASAAWNEGLQTLSVSEGGSAYIYATKTGLHTVTATSGGKTVTFQFYAYNTETDYYTLSAVADSATLAPGATGVVTITVLDVFGNPVDTAANLLLNTASGKVLLGGNVFTADMGTGAAGTGKFSVIANNATGTGSVVIAPKTTGANAWATDYTKPTGAADPVSSVTVTFTVAGSTAKSAEVLASEAAEAEAKKATTTAGEAKTEAALATAAATTAGTKADAAKDAADAATAEAKLATTAATTAGTKADAAKDAADAATAEAKLATTAAAKAGTDAVAAADAAKAAAAKAGTDAVAAADAAKAEAAKATAAATANAVEIAKLMAAITALTTSVSTGNSSASDAYEAAAEAIDAANAATDAANIAAEAADAATVAAEEARDAADAATAAVEELATQVSTLIASLKAQITTLGNTVAKIAKKVRA